MVMLKDKQSNENEEMRAEKSAVEKEREFL